MEGLSIQKNSLKEFFDSFIFGLPANSESYCMHHAIISVYSTNKSSLRSASLCDSLAQVFFQRNVTLGGTTGKLNYYTKLALDIGIKGTTTRTKAGFFVQLNHNIPRLIAGKNWSSLYSNSLTTVMGRQWQNQAIGLGLAHFGASGYGLFNLSNSIDDK